MKLLKQEMSCSERVRLIAPGEHLTLTIPQGLPLEYKTWSNGGYTTKSFVCTKIVVYHWDDDDHWCIDWYLYDSTDHSKDALSWTCKHYDLTKESAEKVYKYLRETEYE